MFILPINRDNPVRRVPYVLIVVIIVNCVALALTYLVYTPDTIFRQFGLLPHNTNGPHCSRQCSCTQVSGTSWGTCGFCGCSGFGSKTRSPNGCSCRFTLCAAWAGMACIGCWTNIPLCHALEPRVRFQV